MKFDQNRPSEAEILASIIKRNGSISMNMASVQRSHRFPLTIFTQIENMARMADSSVSTIINQLLAVGIEAVHDNLTQDEINEIKLISQEQLDRPFKQLKANSKNKEDK